MRGKKGVSEKGKKQWGVLMTLGLQVWAGSLSLIRLGHRPMGGPSPPPLLLHFLLVLAPSLMVPSSNPLSVPQTCAHWLTDWLTAAGFKGDTVVSHCWQMRTGNPRIEPDNGLGNWQAEDRTGRTAHSMLLIIHKSMSRLQHSVTRFTHLRPDKRNFELECLTQILSENLSPENFCSFVTN